MAVLGLYAVLALTVQQRIPEFGVRMALGMRPWDLMRLVIGGGVRLVAVGLLIGIAVAFALGRILNALLAEADANDPGINLGVTVALLAAGCAASFFPATGARRTDPLVALRYE